MHVRRSPRPPLRATRLWPLVVALLLALIVTAVMARPAEAATARVAADGDCLNLRHQPTLAGVVIACVDDGTLVTTIAGQTATADGLDWQQVRVGDVVGWMAARYLVAATGEPATAPEAAPPPAPTQPQALAAPPVGGLTIGVAGTSSPAALAAAQTFPVAGITAIEPETQRYLLFVPGAPTSINSLDATTLRSDSIVMIRRLGELPPLDLVPPTAASSAPGGTPRRLPVPSRGGLTQGVAGTSNIPALIAAQPFAVELVMALDVPSQRWLVYIPGAPDWVNTLNAQTLRPDGVVTVRRSATLPDPAPAATTVAPITYYYCTPGSNPAAYGDGGGFCGAMRNGALVYPGAASCSAANFGQRFRIVGDPTGRTYRCDDTGGGVHNEHRDIWFNNSDEGYAWWLRTAPGGTAPIAIVP